MVRGLYTAAAGMMAQQVRVDTIANNLANVDTSGYKRDEAAIRSFPEMMLSRLDRPAAVPIGRLVTGSVVDEIGTSDRQGPLRETGNPLDFALQDNAFFAVRTAGGDIGYTRQGSFVLDGNGRLVTTAGHVVLGIANGRMDEIYLPGGDLQVSRDGSISGAVNAQGEVVERFVLVGKPLGQGWRKEGDSLYRGAAAQVQNFEVRQGYLEGSNVNPLSEMVAMMSAVKAYEASQKVIQATDSTLEKANEIGRV